MTNNIKALAVYPILSKDRKNSSDKERVLEEISGLVEAMEFELVDAITANVSDINAATFIGKGTVEKIADIVKNNAIDMVVIDTKISPIQQSNLEKALNTKVIDRTAIIIEIFGKRARTKEGVLQVELARLTYQRSRLVKTWTHLERQRGGKGFLGGPGERQLELDRRMIDTKIVRIKKDLEQVKKTRALHRNVRQKVPYDMIALVGYTNAGKSTLFNRLTKADVVAKDQLFATLDTTMRKLILPSRRPAILSDTVGFIADIAAELINAFSATLEEVSNASVILHIRDISHPDTERQKEEVLRTLKGLVSENIFYNKVIEVANKIDLLADEDKYAMLNKSGVVSVSAISGEGIKELLQKIDEVI